MEWMRLSNLMPSRHRIEVVARSLREKLRGLDFTMPDRMYDRNRNDGGMYYASPEGILRELFACVDSRKFSRFIDIGCGKGYVLWQAQSYGFSQVGGVEYDEKLCGICRRNLKRLRLENAVQVTCADACRFDGYGDYDVFYFFNPFMDEIMTQVIDRIIAQCRGREVMLIYYHPRYTGRIEGCGFFTKERVLHDPVKGYTAHIYRGVIPE